MPRSVKGGRVTRHGFLWRAHFWHPFAFTNAPEDEGPAGYSKFVRAWTRSGAKRLANFYRHQGWSFTVERTKP